MGQTLCLYIPLRSCLHDRPRTKSHWFFFNIQVHGLLLLQAFLVVEDLLLQNLLFLLNKIIQNRLRDIFFFLLLELLDYGLAIRLFCDFQTVVHFGWIGFFNLLINSIQSCPGFSCRIYGKKLSNCLCTETNNLCICRQFQSLLSGKFLIISPNSCFRIFHCSTTRLALVLSILCTNTSICKWSSQAKSSCLSRTLSP